MQGDADPTRPPKTPGTADASARAAVALAAEALSGGAEGPSSEGHRFSVSRGGKAAPSVPTPSLLPAPLPAPGDLHVLALLDPLHRGRPGPRDGCGAPPSPRCLCRRSHPPSPPLRAGDFTGVYVFKVKQGTVAGRSLRAGDKLVEVNGYDVTGCSLNDVAAVLADPESAPTPEAPSTLTFVRIEQLAGY